MISLSYILNGSSPKNASNYAIDFIKESKDKINPLIDNFYDVINTLSHKKSIYHEIEKLELKPCGNCTSCYKNCEF
ncbi:hypothetical protein J6P59_07795 [bacterium]|nr:hypothetical protein [bacterium]